MYPKHFFKDPGHLLAFGLGSGCVPKAPGTFGTLAAVLLYWPLSYLPIGLYAAWLLASFLIGIWLCQRASDALGVHDHGGIVWDEFVGYWITMLAAPTGWEWMVLGFVLFRVFDIAKPWPIGWLDRRVHGGFGIMLDDVIAGLFALAGVQGVSLLLS